MHKRIFVFLALGIILSSCQTLYYLPGNKFEPVKIKELFSFGEKGSGPGKFGLIDAIVTDKNGNIYIGDKQGFVHKFNSSGKFIKKIGSQGTGRGEFWDEVKGLAIDSKDRLIAVDEYNERVNLFDLDGNYLTGFGKSGSRNGEFADPTGVAVDDNDNIYIVDSKTFITQKFDNNFKFITKFGGAGSRYYENMSYIDNKVNGNEEGEFKGTESIGYLRGYIYLSDEGHSRIQVYDTSGNFYTTIGSKGIGSGNFYDQVEGISFDDENNVYAVNESNGKWGSVNVYDRHYNPVLQFQPYGYMVSPDGIKVDNINKRIYVVDQGNWKVRVFDLNIVEGHFE